MKNKRLQLNLSLVGASLAAAGLLAACGGSGDDAPAAGASTGTPTAAPAPAATVTTLAGNVVKGPVAGADVCAYKAAPTGKGDKIKCVTSSAGGAYSMNIEFVGDVVIEASGGTYTDEATKTSKTLSDPLQVVVESKGGSTTGMITPLTSVAYSVAKSGTGGVSSASFNTAATTVASQFNLGTGVNIATTAPTLGAGANSYGQALQGVSQYVANGGSLTNFVGWTNPAQLQAGYSAAFTAANGQTITFNFTPTGPNSGTGVVTGTGAGGGTASCAVTVSGSMTTNGMTVPVPATKVCVTGLPSNEGCSNSNPTLSQSISQSMASYPGANLRYDYSTDCSGASYTVAVKS